MHARGGLCLVHYVRKAEQASWGLWVHAWGGLWMRAPPAPPPPPHTNMLPPPLLRPCPLLSTLLLTSPLVLNHLLESSLHPGACSSPCLPLTISPLTSPQVLNHLLEGSLHPDLQALDPQLATWPRASDMKVWGDAWLAL